MFKDVWEKCNNKKTTTNKHMNNHNYATEWEPKMFQNMKNIYLANFSTADVPEHNKPIHWSGN